MSHPRRVERKTCTAGAFSLFLLLLCPYALQTLYACPLYWPVHGLTVLSLPVSMQSHQAEACRAACLGPLAAATRDMLIGSYLCHLFPCHCNCIACRMGIALGWSSCCALHSKAIRSIGTQIAPDGGKWFRCALWWSNLRCTTVLCF